jgi:hypothetical protein
MSGRLGANPQTEMNKNTKAANPTRWVTCAPGAENQRSASNRLHLNAIM